VKILQISPTYSGIGGIAQHVMGLEKYLKKTGNTVDVLSSDNSFTLPVKGLKNPSFMLSSSLKVKFMKKYDIVHAHNIPSAKAMKNAKGKKILSLHGIFSQQIDQLHGNTTGKISKKYEQEALKWADAITVISKEAFDYYTSLGYNVFQIPNAIDVKSLLVNEERQYKNQIIFAGRLSFEKGINSLVSIAQKLPCDFHLIILGEGPEEQKIKDLEKTHENVHYLGYRSKKETISLIRGSDVIVQPSLQEGISSTLLESMACKTAIIASSVGGNNELIKNNLNGITIDPNETDLFVEQIINLFNNKQLQQSLVENAFISVQKYDWNKIGNLYLDIYQSILDKKS
jgi:glycosyltransferase involved in cell wall biosynthesis